VIRALLLALVLALAGCTGGVSYDKEVDDLGAHLVSALKQLPTVADAAYRYDHGLDLGQILRVRAILKRDDTGDDAVRQAIDTATKEFWLSPAAVGHLTIAIYSEANPPAGDSDESNKDRAIGSDNVEDLQAADRPDLERKYGPRPTKAR
jgi:hypothetical protein